MNPLYQSNSATGLPGADTPGRVFRIWPTILCASLALFLGGCVTSQRMVMHLAVADVDKKPATVKFYRVTIKASSTNMKSTLRTGYYDANALRDVFGEVRAADRPTGAVKQTGSLVFRYQPESKSWQYLPPTELFTVIYGADAQALETSIRAFADSDEAGKTLGKLLAAAAGRSGFVEAAEAEQKQKKQLDVAKAVAGNFKAESVKLKQAVQDEQTAAERAAALPANSTPTTPTTPTTPSAPGTTTPPVPGTTTTTPSAPGTTAPSTPGTTTTTPPGTGSPATTPGATTTTPTAPTTPGTTPTTSATPTTPGTTPTPSPGTPPPAPAQKTAATEPTPATTDAGLLSLLRATATQLGFPDAIETDPAKGFAQAKELHRLLQQNANK